MKVRHEALLLRGLLLLVLVASISGCAVRTERLSVPSLPMPLVQDGAKVFTITRVVDSREFAADSSDPTKPWLLPAERNDSDKWMRIVGREPEYVTVASTSARREATEALPIPQAILLEGDQSVERQVRNAVIVGFALSGYRVVEVTGTNPDAVSPIEIEIHKFWGWLDRDEALQARMRFQVEVSITAPQQPFDTTRRIVSRSSRVTSVVNPGARQWRNTIVSAGHELASDIQSLLPASYTDAGDAPGPE